jgi:hypothetical protein
VIIFCVLGALLGGAIALISRSGLDARHAYCVEWEKRIRAKDEEQARQRAELGIDP